LYGLEEGGELEYRFEIGYGVNCWWRVVEELGGGVLDLVCCLISWPIQIQTVYLISNEYIIIDWDNRGVTE
jgi:hypothetical protein